MKKIIQIGLVISLIVCLSSVKGENVSEQGIGPMEKTRDAINVIVSGIGEFNWKFQVIPVRSSINGFRNDLVSLAES